MVQSVLTDDVEPVCWGEKTAVLEGNVCQTPQMEPGLIPHQPAELDRTSSLRTLQRNDLLLQILEGPGVLMQFCISLDQYIVNTHKDKCQILNFSAK